MPSHRRNSGGPPLGLLALISAGLFVGSVVAGAVMAKAAYPSPFSTASKTIDYVQQHRGAVRITALLQFGSAIPLAIYAAAASARLRNLGIRAPGATIALVGGTIASAFLLLSSMITWTLSRPDVASEPTIVRTLSFLSFMAGGPGSVVPFGLLLAGIAVPALLGRLIPRPIAAVGLLLAVMHAILVVPGVAWLLGRSGWSQHLQLRVTRAAIALYTLSIGAIAPTF